MSEAPPADHPFLGIHAVDVYVRDQDDSLRFYVDKLGFTVAFDARLQSGERWVAVAPPDGSTVLALTAPRPDAFEYKLIGRSTGVVIVTEDVPAKYHEWSRRGVRFMFSPRLRRVSYEGLHSGVSPVWGGIFTRFVDPDGNSFSLVSFDEVNRAVQAERRRAAEKWESERRAAQELEIARQVQARLFPQSLPRMETLEYAGVCVQARTVGGDYHDFLELGGGRFGLVIADISGKGIAAALLMANLQANLRSQCVSAIDEPERLLRSVNKLFFENTSDSRYATLFFAEYDDRCRRLRYINCGHVSALLLRSSGAVERLDSTATVVGLFPEWNCDIEELRLAPGDVFALYTDGITETFNTDGTEFGEARLTAVLAASRNLAPEAMVQSVVGEVMRFASGEQQDDITLIVAKCR